MNLSQCKELGVFFANAEDEIKDFLLNHYPGFDLEQVVRELEDVADKWGFEWGRKHIAITPSGSLHIHYQYDNLHSDESLILTRFLKKPDVKGRRVVHQELVLPEEFQGAGKSRDLILPFYIQYRKANVDFIDVTAGYTGGGYALAKYGFAATDSSQVFDILKTASERGVSQAAIDFLVDDAKEFYDTHPPGTPFPMWEWTKSPSAKKLLVGTYWHGVLNLHDRLQRDLFETYLYPDRNIFALL